MEPHGRPDNGLGGLHARGALQLTGLSNLTCLGPNGQALVSLH